MSIIHVKNDEEFKKQVLESKVPVIVDFYADWCPPCRSLGKVFESIIEDSNGWNIVKLNCDDEGVKPIASQHGVSGIPAVFFYNQGKQVPEHGFTGNNQNKLQQTVQAASALVGK